MTSPDPVEFAIVGAAVGATNRPILNALAAAKTYRDLDTRPPVGRFVSHVVRNAVDYRLLGSRMAVETVLGAIVYGVLGVAMGVMFG